ncbi:MAG: hypothetical protein ACRCXM_17495 [Beijerinckiaceae bacterium]
MLQPESVAGAGKRLVIIGRNAKVWQRLAGQLTLPPTSILAISHTELDSYKAGVGDIVWIFSYAREPETNRTLLEALRRAGVRQTIYLSTATAIVADETGCYTYPRVKRQAERDAIAMLGAKICRIGVMYQAEDELPSGSTAATSYGELGAAMLDSARPTANSPEHHDLWRIVYQPFSNRAEENLYRVYGVALRAVRAFPCLLRPFDLALRLMGFRWYGYVYLGTQLCMQTTSSSAQA